MRAVDSHGMVYWVRADGLRSRMPPTPPVPVRPTGSGKSNRWLAVNIGESSHPRGPFPGLSHRTPAPLQRSHGHRRNLCGKAFSIARNRPSGLKASRS